MRHLTKAALEKETKTLENTKMKAPQNSQCIPAKTEECFTRCVGTCRVIGRETVSAFVGRDHPYAGAGWPAAVPAFLQIVKSGK